MIGVSQESVEISAVGLLFYGELVVVNSILIVLCLHRAKRSDDSPSILSQKTTQPVQPSFKIILPFSNRSSFPTSRASRVFAFRFNAISNGTNVVAIDRTDWLTDLPTSGQKLPVQTRNSSSPIDVTKLSSAGAAGIRGKL